jgi:hypothetical protein
MPTHTASRRLAALLLTALPLLATGPAAAFDTTPDGTLPDRIFRQLFEGRPVSGQLVIKGYPMAFPPNSHVNGAHQASPATYVGRFWFPSSTLQSNVNGLGMVTLNTQLIHLASSSNPIAAPNVASIQVNDVYLHLMSATVSGIPVSLGNDCIFGPIQLNAQGSWNVSQATMSGNAVTIPPAPANACGGYASTLNNSIAGNTNNSVTINITL